LKKIDFNSGSQTYISHVAKKRNNISRKPLGSLTSAEYFIKHVNKECSALLVQGT